MTVEDFETLSNELQGLIPSQPYTKNVLHLLERLSDDLERHLEAQAMPRVLDDAPPGEAR